MKKTFFIISLLLLWYSSSAQTNERWQGKKCAVVITYDDAIDQHLDNALPVLDSLDLKATFYITAFSSSVQKRLSDWKKLAVKGHELGNHTLYHPCLGNLPGRGWVTQENDLSLYTVKRIQDEIRMTNLFLQALDGKTERTYAYTCGDMKIGDTSFIYDLKNEFIAARSVRNKLSRIEEVDLYDTDCYVVNGESAEQMIRWVKEAEKTGSLFVILFHGVDGGNPLNVSSEAHREFLTYLKNHEQDIWIAPMLDVAKHIRQWQAANR